MIHVLTRTLPLVVDWAISHYLASTLQFFSEQRPVIHPCGYDGVILMIDFLYSWSQVFY